jgi:hypothetical protein
MTGIYFYGTDGTKYHTTAYESFWELEDAISEGDFISAHECEHVRSVEVNPNSIQHIERRAH